MPSAFSSKGLAPAFTRTCTTPLHLAAQSGHEALVRLLLNSPGVQVDAATTVNGVIPLHLAAQHGHLAVVSLLLSKSTALIHIRDKKGRIGLHLASSNGQYEMVALLIGQGSDINALDSNGWTALHYATKAGHLNVVKLLCDGGANTTIQSNDQKTPICFAATANHTDVFSYLLRKKHNTSHLMNDKQFVFDLMVCGRTNEQKSIEEFIVFSPAPCETAARLSKSFAELATKEKDRSKDLLLAAQFCEGMATELMAIGCSMNSPRILLKSVDKKGHAFLDVLIDCEQKEVVSHPTIQKYLTDLWRGGINWATWKIVLLFLAFIIAPPVWVAFSLPLKHKYNKVPIIKFMSYLVSHIFFILLLILVVAVPVYPIYESYSLLPNICEWLLLAWLSGLLVAELTNPGDRTGLGWLKIIILILCAISILIHFIGFAFSGSDRYTCIFIRNQVLSFSLLLCFVQFLDFLSFHHLFGPWAIIISTIILDLVKFLVILTAFMMGFTLQMSAIYQPVYPESLYNDTETAMNGTSVTPPTLINVFSLLYFALYGIVDPAIMPPTVRSPAWTVEILKTVLGIFLMATVIILVNLLIAMMSDTYQRIKAQSDVEWKFGRSKLIRNMNKTSSTPSPINLLAKMLIYGRVLIKHKGRFCTAECQDLVDDAEDLGSDTDDDTADPLLASQSWLRGVKNTQVAPETKLEKLKKPAKIEEAIDWKLVVHKYYVNKGSSDDQLNEQESTRKPNSKVTD